MVAELSFPSGVLGESSAKGFKRYLGNEANAQCRHYSMPSILIFLVRLE
jgi:hypothetical protein